MTEKEKSIFELLFKYISSRGCEYGEIDLQPWGLGDLKTQSDRYFACGIKDKHTVPENFPIGIKEFIGNFLNSEYIDIGEDDLTEVRLTLYPSTKLINLDAVYQELGDGASEKHEISSESNSDLKQLFKDLTEQEIYPWAEVTFQGGGDNGYIDSPIMFPDKPSKDMSIVPQLEDVLYDMLNNFGGWEINEGSYGKFTIDTRAETITIEFTWNEYFYETILIKSWNVND